MSSLGVGALAAYIALTLFYIFCFIVSYLICSLNFAKITTKLFRNETIAVVITFIGDFLKGFISIIVITIMINSFFINLSNDGNIFHRNVNFIFVLAEYIVLYGSLTGHLFPIYHKFQGSKNIVVSLGVTMFLSPITGIFCLVSFLITLIIKRNTSLGAIIFAVMLPLGIGIDSIGEEQQLAKILLTLPMTIYIISKNKKDTTTPNITISMKGAEHI